ncbi:urea ABC transporter ATP-binding protein UrtD [Thermus islandicus]|uniref:urea ABC transporter ATP-binding protein UrtD n=1 Tax=Thermus islandicus TaxID=540988 RepID=UPI0003B77985|nr:urea ABC transporter ATP-binding protein UrtD [Thermus islandicus]
MDELLRVEDLVVEFAGGFRALNGVNLTVASGELRILVGPNGAGKSTLLDAIIGRVRPSQGRILFHGQPIQALPEHLIARQGIARKFQTPGVLEELSVYENLLLAARRVKGLWSSLSWKPTPEEEKTVGDLLTRISLEEKAYTLARRLAHGERQWLELGMVLATGAKLVLLDEPTAGMTRQEVEKTAELVKSLRGSRAFLVVDHDMAFVAMLEAPVTVLHQGQVLAEGSYEEVQNHPEVVAVYLGGAHA